MALTAQQLADLMPDVTQLESNEPECDSSLHCTIGKSIYISLIARL